MWCVPSQFLLPQIDFKATRLILSRLLVNNPFNNPFRSFSCCAVCWHYGAVESEERSRGVHSEVLSPPAAPLNGTVVVDVSASVRSTARGHSRAACDRLPPAETGCSSQCRAAKLVVLYHWSHGEAVTAADSISMHGCSTHTSALTRWSMRFHPHSSYYSSHNYLKVF